MTVQGILPNDAAPHLPPLTQWFLPTLQEKKPPCIKSNFIRAWLANKCIHPVAQYQIFRHTTFQSSGWRKQPKTIRQNQCLFNIMRRQKNCSLFSMANDAEDSWFQYGFTTSKKAVGHPIISTDIPAPVLLVIITFVVLRQKVQPYPPCLMSYLYGLQCMFYQLLVGLIQNVRKILL